MSSIWALNFQVLFCRCAVCCSCVLSLAFRSFYYVWINSDGFQRNHIKSMLIFIVCLCAHRAYVRHVYVYLVVVFIVTYRYKCSFAHADTQEHGTQTLSKRIERKSNREIRAHRTEWAKVMNLMIFRYSFNFDG